MLKRFTLVNSIISITTITSTTSINITANRTSTGMVIVWSGECFLWHSLGSYIHVEGFLNYLGMHKSWPGWGIPERHWLK